MNYRDMTCPHCGSNNVRFEAWVEWCYEVNRWVAVGSNENDPEFLSPNMQAACGECMHHWNP